MAKIVLIEPDRVLAKTYFQALRAKKHVVNVCNTAQAAIFCADEVKPDLIILELQLVGHSGIEFLYEFRSYPDWQNVPVLILTNVPAGEFADSWQLLREDLGVKAYHYKPLTSLVALQRSVAEVLKPTAATFEATLRAEAEQTEQLSQQASQLEMNATGNA